MTGRVCKLSRQGCWDRPYWKCPGRIWWTFCTLMHQGLWASVEGVGWQRPYFTMTPCSARTSTLAMTMGTSSTGRRRRERWTRWRGTRRRRAHEVGVRGGLALCRRGWRRRALSSVSPVMAREIWRVVRGAPPVYSIWRLVDRTSSSCGQAVWRGEARYRTIGGSTWVPEQVHVPVVSVSYESGQNDDRGNGDDWSGSAMRLVKTPTWFAAES